MPIYVGEAHAGGLGWELLAELGAVPSLQLRQRVEDYAMFGVLPFVGAELHQDRCPTG